MKKAKFMGVTLREKDIVLVKFKSLNDIIADGAANGQTYQDLIDETDMDEYMAAIIHGGHFMVSCVEDGDAYVYNHFRADRQFALHKEVVESVELVTCTDKFFCQEMQIAAVKVGSQLFINGSPLSPDLDEDSNRHYKINRHAKFLKMMENYITDRAVTNMLEQEAEGAKCQKKKRR